MEAKVVELSDETLGGGCLAGAVEEIGAGEVALGRIGGERVPGGDQNGMLQRHKGSAAATADD